MTPDDVIAFWFGERRGPYDVGPGAERWFSGGEAFDAEIRERFAALHARAVAGDLDDWAEAPRGALALVIVLDQFSRNLARGGPEAFAQDPHAQRILRQTLERGFDERLEPAERVMLYMPFMHAESVDLQAEGCRRFEALAASCPEEHRERYANYAHYAERHRAVIERFGRFPHRHERLGREPTSEEAAYLASPDAERFG